MPASNVRGILSMLAAVATFAIMDLSMKRLAETYPAMQVTFIRALASLPFLLLATATVGRWRDLVPNRWGLHLLRGVLQVTTLYLFVYAVSRLSLATAYTIFMSGPLLITALSVPFFGERVGWHRWLAVIVGMIGVLVVVQPGGDGAALGGAALLGGVAAVASAATYALGVLMIRVLKATETSAATMFWPLLLTAAFAGVLAVGNWVPVLWHHWHWIAIIGVSGAIGQHFITEAFRLAAPPVIAPLEYTALAWGMLFDWLLWMTVPNQRMLIGAAIIVASGLYVIHRERLQALAASQTT
ncbi:DMT family transporter [Steroidobacter cummioxidans]|uniref:DMT family transporter n=1 Tax=Steroidobacter cummioxidans TaxID=1803913 RepID=UPI000E321557|nr:DMT family transporter [Steroidobacter cummioxidans]